MSLEQSSGIAQLASQPPHENMVWIPGGTFLMGSDKHYPEESPAHQATVEGFWIDQHTITNEQFARFVEATGHVTSAERAPNPEDYPGALPELLKPASVVFSKPNHKGRSARSLQLVDLHRQVRTGVTPKGLKARLKIVRNTPSCILLTKMLKHTPNGPGRICLPKPSGNLPHAEVWKAPTTPGATTSSLAVSRWQMSGKVSSHGKIS